MLESTNSDATQTEVRTDATAEDGTGRLRPDKLGVFSVAFFVVAAAAPVAAIVGAGPVIFAAVGPATPLVYAITALLIALFAVGYLRMSRYITNAGGFVAYIAKGLGRSWATAGAGIAVLTYLSLQIGLWSQFGVFAGELLKTLTGLDVPPIVLILVLLAAATALTMGGIDASVRVLGILILGETAVVSVLVGSLIVKHGWGIFTFAGFTSANLFGPGLGIAVLFAFLCFTCFEATVVFSEEAVNPRKTIPRALYLVIAFVGLFFTVSTWAIGGAVGIDAVQQTATQDPAGFIFDLASASGGDTLSMSLQVLVVTSYLAMLLGLTNMFSRYLFALGRAGVLPTPLAKVSRKGVPAKAGLYNGIVIAAVVSAFLFAGTDPLAVFAWFSALGTGAFITILLVTSAAVIAFFIRLPEKTGMWATRIAPALSIAVFAYIGYLTFDNYDALLGAGNGAAEWLLVLIPVVIVAGILLGRAKPQIDYSAEII